MKCILTVVTAAAVILMSTGSMTFATPGALKANGCHKSHCHGFSGARKFSNGRHYIPGHFSHSKKRRRK